MLKAQARTEPLAVASAGANADTVVPGHLDPACNYRISRYLQLRPSESGFIAESLITGQRQRLNSPGAVRLLLCFTTPARLGDVLEQTGGRNATALLDFLGRCLDIGLLTRVSNGDVAEEDSIGSLRAWEPHDIAFHLRSRRGRNPMPLGATWHLENTLPAEPAIQPERTDVLDIIPLSRPDLREPSGNDWPLTRALESRRSRYGTGAVPLPLLGELLYRACRVTGRIAASNEELVRKVYPSGGSRHSLGLYVVVNRCAGLSSGGYRYDPVGHRLELLRHESADLVQLLREAQAATGVLPDLPSILLVVASRIGRVTRKYQSNAYRVILQEVGALYQTVYLVAETLGLTASAIGGGDSDRFSKAFGTDFFAEPSVGEMIIGTIAG